MNNRLASTIESISASPIGVAQTLVLVAAALIAYVQYRAFKEENRIRAILAACDRYDTDPVVRHAVQVLHLRYMKPADNPDNEREHAIVSLWNYFDSIALGTMTGSYDFDMVRRHLGTILMVWYDEGILSETHMPESEFNKDYQSTRWLRDKLQRYPRR